MDLYKGGILESAADEHWLIPKASYYSLRYQGIVSELLKTLAYGKDYHNLHRYAAQALAIDPGHGTAHYWLIYSMAQRGANELATIDKRRVLSYVGKLTGEQMEQINTALLASNLNTQQAGAIPQGGPGLLHGQRMKDDDTAQKCVWSDNSRLWPWLFPPGCGMLCR